MINDRNRHIENNNKLTGQALNFFQLDSMIGLKKSIADGECIIALELLLKLLDMRKSVEVVGATYAQYGKPARVILPDVLDEVLTTLKTIAAEVNPAALRGMTFPG